MNQFFATPFSQEDLVARRRSQNGARRNSSIAMLPPSPAQQEIDTSIMLGGDSLDDIIMQNSQEFQRRQSLPMIYGNDMASDHDRRASMMEFGAGSENLNGYQFGARNSSTNVSSGNRRQTIDEMDMGGAYDMTGNMGMGMGPGGFSASLQSNPLTIDTNASYGISQMSPEMMSTMMSYPSMGLGDIDETAPVSMYGQNNYYGSANMSQMPSNYVLDIGNSVDPVSDISNDRQSMSTNGADDDDMMNLVPGLGMSTANNGFHMPMTTVGQFSPTMAHMPSAAQSTHPYSSAVSPRIEAVSPAAKEEPTTSYQNVYSSSGFDMLKALMRVATRKNPEINIGAVDMSCAFVVCDITQNDCPIIYVSDIFERLTGYTKHEVLGQNCRFLQAPDGKVTAGVKRKYVDDDSVHYLKNRIKDNKEAQRSLINYRKGGQPFMNLLTMIPISWDDTDEIKYFVGFQVDLVEQPTSLASKSAGGTYTVNYSQGTLPRYRWEPPEAQRSLEKGQTISRDDVTAVLATFSGADGEVSKRMWDKVLLENTDDVVHVLSLKGLFMYLSQSCRKVLEYEPNELVGTALSSVCHPSDIVPVTRELKDTSNGSIVNVVFRIRRKKSGYTWFESHGSLSVEHGKGRKCIILVGRERPVYALQRSDIEAAGGIGENELWTKLSTSGMLLFISSTVRSLLDRQPDDLIGTSIQALMRPESKVEVGRLLERARTGKRVLFHHEILNKKGQALQALTTLYPGDAGEGSKPTFLVGQTRLTAKRQGQLSVESRVTGASKPGGSVGKTDADSPPNARNSPHEPRGDATPRSSASTLGREHVISQAGGSALPIGTQDLALASEDNIFDELKTTRCTSWQFELRQMEKSNRLLAEELASLLASKKKRKRRKGTGNVQRDCANCHTNSTPEWRRGPSGQRDLCNSCGLRWAKQVSEEYDPSTLRMPPWTESDSS
jgi:PAS domain S-box-containing protein